MRNFLREYIGVIEHIIRIMEDMLMKKTIIIAVAMIVVMASVVGFILYKTTNKEEEPNQKKEYVVEYIDAEEYFTRNSRSVVSSSLQQDSEELLSETNAVKLLHSLGFIQYAITTEYSASGDFYEEREITGDNPEKHPIYQTFYYTENRNLWTVSIVRNQIMAYPVSYAMRAGENVVVSLSRTITSYDNISKLFFVTEPKEDVLRVIVVEKIDSEVLEAITDETLSGKR